jgi:hypothetical protein
VKAREVLFGILKADSDKSLLKPILQAAQERWPEQLKPIFYSFALFEKGGSCTVRVCDDSEPSGAKM